MKSFKCIMKKLSSKLVNTNTTGYNKFIELLEEGDEVIVEFKRKKDMKTNDQLALAHKLLSLIRKETGNSILGLDMYVKQEMGKLYIEKVEGKEVPVETSKADFSKEELSDYIDILVRLAQKYNITIPVLGY